MPVIIRVCAIHGNPPPGPTYLQFYDIEHDRGAGLIVTTHDRSRAIPFKDTAEALNCWQQRSKQKPWRADGKPNRPLTVLSIEIESFYVQ